MDKGLVTELRELHHSYPVTLYGGEEVLMCWHCNTGDPYCTVSMEWPCPTMAIVERHG